MKISMKNTRWPVLLLASAFAVACGSSGGKDVIDDDELIVLPLYNYQLTSTADDPITVTAFGGLQLQLGHLGEGPGLFGAYQVADGTFSVFEGSSLVVDELGGPLFAGDAQADVLTLFGDFTVRATADWLVPADSDPETGALEVARGKERIEVAVINAGNTVRLRYDAAGDGVYETSAEFTWAEFEDLGDVGEPPEWQLLGKFAYDATLEFMLELADIGISAFGEVDDDLAQSGGQVVEQCDAFSSLGLSVPPVPPGIPNQGFFTFSWLDDAANGSVGPGDSFNWDFEYCLSDDPDDDIDDMLNGVVGLNSLTEVYVQRPAGETLVRIGWEGPGIPARPGGVHFSELERWEVFDADGNGAGTVAAAELTSTVDGRMTLVFFEP